MHKKTILIHHSGMSYHCCNLYITMTQLVHIYNLNIDQHIVYIVLCHQQMPLAITLKLGELYMLYIYQSELHKRVDSQ